MKSLDAGHFYRILTETENSLPLQYKELLKIEGVDLEFSDEAIKEVAELTAAVNAKVENIGARRLHTLMEQLLEELSFTAHDLSGQQVNITRCLCTR